MPAVPYSDPSQSNFVATKTSKTIVFAPHDLPRAIEALGFIAGLAARYPNDRIDVFAPLKLAALFEHCSVVEVVWRYEPNEKSVTNRPGEIGSLEPGMDWVSRLALAKQIAKEHYDRAIFLEHSRYQPLFLMLAGVRARWGFGPHLPLTLTRTLRRIGGQPHRPTRLPQWLELAQIQALPTTLSRPKMDSNYARRKFGVSALVPIVLCVAGHSNSLAPDQKDWPNRYWFELAQQIQERFGATQIVFIGDTADRSRATEISTLVGPLAHNLCGMTSVYETMALMNSALAVIGSDHVLLHLSSAMGVPNIGIFGGTDPRTKAPKSSHHRSLWLHLECSPCRGPNCHLGRALCMERITPRDALNALELSHSNTQAL